MNRRLRLASPGRAFQAGLLLLLCFSCAGRKADFGTLPQVSVPIEKQPEQDPTLFREDKPQRLPLPTSDPPDPRPLRSRDHYDYVVEFDKGDIEIASVKAVHLKQPRSAERRLGRFAFELWSGAELVERVRFDFPLLGASQADEEDPLGAGLSSKAKVRIPASSRASHARILDRKTRREIEIPWPPETSKSAGPTAPSGETNEP